MVNHMMRGKHLQIANDQPMVPVFNRSGKDQWHGIYKIGAGRWTDIPADLAKRFVGDQDYAVPSLGWDGGCALYFKEIEHISPSRNRPSISEVMLSILVLAHNQKAFTKRCIDSLLQYTSGKFEIVFIDNGSTDGTPELIEAYADQRIRYIRSDVNLGVGKGRNLGFQYVTGDVVCILDNDIEVGAGWNHRLLAALLSDPYIGMVGIDGSVKNGDQEFAPVMRTGEFTETDYVRGLCQMFWRDLIEIVGPIDPNMVWHEDSEFSGRIRHAGFKVGYVPVPMVHGDGTTTRVVRGADYMARCDVDLHYLRQKLSADNTAWIHRSLCRLGVDCPDSLCMITKTITDRLRQWGYTAIRRPTVAYDYKPLLLSSAFHMALRGHRIGTYHVENDRVSKQYVAGWDVDLNLCTSRHMVEAFRRSGVPEEKLIFCNVNSVDTGVFAVSEHRKRKKPFRFLWVGASQPRKGLDVILSAFADAFGPKDDVELVLKDGNYGQVAELKKAVAKHPLKAKIKVIDAILSQDELAELYRTASFDCGAFVHPHRAEGFGRTVLEAALCGCRVGVTGWGGPMDFVDERTTTLFGYELARSTFHNNPQEPYFNRQEEQPKWAEPDVKDVVKWMQGVVKEKCNPVLLAEVSESLACRYNHQAVADDVLDCIQLLLDDGEREEDMYGVTYWHGGEGANYADYQENELHSAQAKLLFDMFNLKGKKLLEIGAGYGYLVKHLRLLGVDAHGIDISEHAVTNSPVREYMSLGDVATDGIEGRYDFIFSLDTFEHVHPDRLRRVFREVYSALKFGGAACIIPGTLECPTFHKDTSHQIFRNPEWWDKEFFTVFKPTGINWSAKIREVFEFANIWKWHVLVGRRS